VAHVRAALGAALVALLLVTSANAFDLVTADGTNVDPNGHEHAGQLDPANFDCGVYSSGAAQAGAQSDATTYNFVQNQGTPDVAARAPDHAWVQAAGTTPVVWDMGKAVDSVVVFETIDHAPIPDEAFEYTAYGSDSPDPAAPAEQGDITVIYDPGFSNWISDDDSARWSFTTPHRYVRITAGGPGAIQSDGDAEIDAVCANLPPPASGTTANAAPKSGFVEVKPPGATTFVPLQSADQIPVGSVVNATDGTVKLTTASTTGDVQSAAFHRGQFKILQQASAVGLTELQLVGGRSESACHVTTKAAHAAHAARKKLSKSVLRQLFGRGHGIYKANGKHANLTIHGTSFLIQDRCDGTFVKLIEGNGTVRDKVRRRTVRLRAGQSYLARAR
jgi:hypothetical protein